MINNFDQIAQLISSDEKNEDLFHQLHIIQRKKDGHKKTRVFKTYYISSVDYLLEKREEIINLCNLLNGRAMFDLNIHSYKRVAINTFCIGADLLKQENYYQFKNIYSKTVGKTSLVHKLWIIDVDEEDMDKLGRIAQHLSIDTEIVGRIPSKTGFHYIVKPFDRRLFSERFSNIQVCKNNPTNLYIP